MCHGAVPDLQTYVVPIAPYVGGPETIDRFVPPDPPQPPVPHLRTWAGYSGSNCLIFGGIVAICLLVVGVVWRIFLIRRLLRERSRQSAATATSTSTAGKEVAGKQGDETQGAMPHILVLGPDGQPTGVAVSDKSSLPATAPTPGLASPSRRRSKRRPSCEAANGDETPRRHRRASSVRVSPTPVGHAAREPSNPIAGGEADALSQPRSVQMGAGSYNRAESAHRSRAERGGSSRGRRSGEAWVSNTCTGLGTNCRCVACVVAVHTAMIAETADRGRTDPAWRQH